MAILTQDGYVAASMAGEFVRMLKTVTRTAVALQPYSVFDIAGNPGAGTLAGSSASAGVVPTDATAGHPTIKAFGVGATGYLDRFDCGNIVACDIALYDCLWKGGTYTHGAAVTNLSAQPSYSSRVPGGTDFQGLELWYESVTASTGNPSVTVGYTDQDGNTGASTGAHSIGAATPIGRMFPFAFASGDSGIQKVESVVSATASAGTFNILVLRKLAEGRVGMAGGRDLQGPDRTGRPIVFADSALMLIVRPDSTATQTPDVTLKIING